MAGKKEEGNTEVFWGKRTRTYYPRRCKRNRLTSIESLPDDLMSDILARVPAQDIHHRARLVCRKWYHMIHTPNFLHAHLQHTTYGLLFHDWFFNLYFVTLQRGRIEISEIGEYRSIVPISCNGFFLEMLPRHRHSLCITNLVLNQKFILPPYHSPVVGSWRYGMAYSAATQEYKVLLTYSVGSPSTCSILTVGVDHSWRDFDTQHLSVEARHALFESPLITEGFMHWAKDGIQVLTLNVETETITETPAPMPQVDRRQDRKTYYYLSGGRYLSLLVACKRFSFEVWEMKPETGEWRKVHSIVLEGDECKLEECGVKHDEHLIPVGWVKYLEVLAIGSSKGQSFIFYNLNTHEMKVFKPPERQPAGQKPFSCREYIVMIHKNTLSWFN